MFTVIENDGVNVTIEVSEEDYQADLAGIDVEATMKPGRYVFKCGGFLARHPELKRDNSANEAQDADDDLRPEYDFSKMQIVRRGPGRKRAR